MSFQKCALFGVNDAARYCGHAESANGAGFRMPANFAFFLAARLGRGFRPGPSSQPSRTASRSALRRALRAVVLRRLLSRVSPLQSPLAGQGQRRTVRAISFCFLLEMEMGVKVGRGRSPAPVPQPRRLAGPKVPTRRLATRRLATFAALQSRQTP